MAEKNIYVSALDSRIKQGKADPITPAEKRLVAELRKGYEKKYGGFGSAKTGRVITSSSSPRASSVSTEKTTPRTSK